MFKMYIQGKCRYTTDNFQDMINAIHNYFNCVIYVYKDDLLFSVYERWYYERLNWNDI